jgi:hypothetical protein
VEEIDHHPQNEEPLEHLGEEEVETPMMKEKDLDEGQMREGKEDGTRDPHLCRRKIRKMKIMNSSSSCHESLPMPWDDEPESQRNPLPYSKMRGIKTFACGFYHVRITSTETSGNGGTKHNESDTL